MFRNASTRSHYLLPLISRDRKIQPNMALYDEAGSNLIYLHSSWIKDIESAYLHGLLTKILTEGELVDDAEVDEDYRILSKVADFSLPDDIQSAIKSCLERLSKLVPCSEDFAELVNFVWSRLWLYVPFAELKYPLEPGHSKFIHNKVDFHVKAKMSLSEKLCFYVLGKITLDIELPVRYLAQSRFPFVSSLHTKIESPSGLVLTESPKLVNCKSKFSEYLIWDQRGLYLYLDREAIESGYKIGVLSGKTPFELKNEKSTKNGAQERPEESATITGVSDYEPTENYPSINLKMKLAAPAKSLIALLWVVVFFAIVSRLPGYAYLGNLGLWFSAYVVVVLTVVIYASDKSFAHRPILFHTWASTVAMLLVFVFPILAKILLSLLSHMGRIIFSL